MSTQEEIIRDLTQAAKLLWFAIEEVGIHEGKVLSCARLVEKAEELLKRHGIKLKSESDVQSDADGFAKPINPGAGEHEGGN
jgi:hypothetical protein